VGIHRYRWRHLVGAVCLGTGTLIGLGIPLSTENAPATTAQAQVASPAEAALNRGLTLIQQGSVDAAIAAFQESIQIDPSMAAAHYNLGLALRQTGELQEAADAFWQALEADPQFAMAYSNLGASLWEGGNLDQATEYLERAIALQPD